MYPNFKKSKRLESPPLSSTRKDAENQVFYLNQESFSASFFLFRLSHIMLLPKSFISQTLHTSSDKDSKQHNSNK